MIIKKAEYITSGTKAIHIPDLNVPEFVLMGRSNVGKSSFINAIVNRKNMAYTSSKPGKTITLNFYNINDAFMLVDVPGYGYAQRLVHDRLAYGKMIEDYLEKSAHLKAVFLIVDSRHEPTGDDVLMYQFLKHLNQTVIIIATKTDKISKNELQKSLKAIKKKLETTADDKIIPVSSETKAGIDEVHTLIESYLM